MTWRSIALAAGLIVSALAAPGSAATRLDARQAMDKSEQAVGRTLANYRLIDSRGAPLALRDYRGKPLVISLVYTACSSVCPPTSNENLPCAGRRFRSFGLISLRGW